MKFKSIVFIVAIFILGTLFGIFVYPKQTKTNNDAISKYAILNKLSPEVQISYFIHLLGEPVYKNILNEKDYIYLKKISKDIIVNEYIFVDIDYYVQAITDEYDKVISYAITSRKKDFTPTFKMEGLFDISLNKTPINELSAKSTNKECYRFLGAHDPAYYFEKTYFGNPGNYLTYLVGVSNIAWSNKGIPEYFDEKDPYGGWQGTIDCDKVSENYRTTAFPNTFIVWTDSIPTNEEGEPSLSFFGPQHIQVRALNE
ncbi:hypothetical protein KKB64_05120 [Patescibacteria group bacterium]|nr:hypothetical protein [Patescibacteria group bacterium]MBU1473133.1 hypothetical protein [Patescibacteria group bacterium]